MSNRAFDLLVFDWDGTIVDSAATIVSALQTACRKLGLTVPSREQALGIIGLGMREALFQVVPELTEVQFEALRERFRAEYAAIEQQVFLFDGVWDGLHQLREQGYMMAVATGKSRGGLNRAMAQVGLDRFFDYTRCADECPSKPAPDMLLDVMDFLNVPVSRTLMIGDTTHDLLMARNANVSSAAVLYGAHPESLLVQCQPVIACHTFSALVAWILKSR